MNYTEALEYIHKVSSLGSLPGLSRIQKICELFDNPQDSLKFIHVAGTNGKGSVSSMLSNILLESGKKVGLFTSPYIYDFNERFRINGNMISNDEFAEIVSRVAPIADSMEDHPSEFELDCIVGFLWFKEQKCDVVVLEVGMGGRYDGTNIIKSSILSIITSISLDHTAILGDTKEKIAYEKAGIIKNGCPVITGICDNEPLSVIKDIAENNHSKLYTVNALDIDNIQLSLEGTSFSYMNRDKYFVSLAGEYQAHNAALCISSCEILGISDEIIRKGLSKTNWSARFEQLATSPIVIYDGGHNPEGIEYTVESIKKIFNTRINILTGVLKDKDYLTISDKLSEIASNVFCIEPPNPRKLSAEDYSKCFRNIGISATPYINIYDGVSSAFNSSKATQTPLLIVGSLYMYKEIKDILTSLL